MRAAIGVYRQWATETDASGVTRFDAASVGAVLFVNVSDVMMIEQYERDTVAVTLRNGTVFYGPGTAARVTADVCRLALDAR